MHIGRNPLTGKPVNQIGAAWWTVGAQGGVSQPPYIVRWKNRWYRTLPVHVPSWVDEPVMDAETLAVVRNLPVLDFGVRRGLDYLNRANKRFDDLPLWTAAQGHTRN